MRASVCVDECACEQAVTRVVLNGSDDAVLSAVVHDKVSGIAREVCGIDEGRKERRGRDDKEREKRARTENR